MHPYSYQSIAHSNGLRLLYWKAWDGNWGQSDVHGTVPLGNNTPKIEAGRASTDSDRHRIHRDGACVVCLQSSPAPDFGGVASLFALGRLWLRLLNDGSQYTEPIIVLSTWTSGAKTQALHRQLTPRQLGSHREGAATDPGPKSQVACIVGTVHVLVGNWKITLATHLPHFMKLWWMSAPMCLCSTATKGCG